MEGETLSSRPYGAHGATYYPPPQTQPPQYPPPFVHQPSPYHPPIPYPDYYSQPPPHYWQPPTYPHYPTEYYPPQYPPCPNYQSSPQHAMQAWSQDQMAYNTRMAKIEGVLDRFEESSQQMFASLRAAENSLSQILQELRQRNLEELPSTDDENPKDTEHCSMVEAEERPTGMVLEARKAPEKDEQSLEQKSDSDMPATENNKAENQEAVTEQKDQPPFNVEEKRECKGINVRMGEILKNSVGKESNQTGKPAEKAKNVRMGEKRVRQRRGRMENVAGVGGQNKDVAADIFHRNKKRQKVAF